MASMRKPTLMISRTVGLSSAGSGDERAGGMVPGVVLVFHRKAPNAVVAKPTDVVVMVQIGTARNKLAHGIQEVHHASEIVVGVDVLHERRRAAPGMDRLVGHRF